MKDGLKSVVEWFENRLGLSLLFFFRNTGYLVLNNVGAVLLMFATSFFFARLLSKEQFGAYSYVHSLVSLFSFFGLPSLSVAVMKAVAKKKNSIVAQAYGLTVFGSAVATVGLVISALYIFWVKGNNELAGLVIIASLMVPMFYASNVYGSYFAGRGKFRALAWMDFAKQASVGLILAGTMLVKPYVPLLLLESLLIPGLWGYYYIRKTKISRGVRSFVPKVSNAYLRLGIKLSVYDSLLVVSRYADKVLIGMWLSLEDLAVYSFAVALPEALKGVIKQLKTVGFARISSHSKEVVSGNLMRHSLIMLTGVVAVVILYIFSAPIIFNLFFPRYLDSVPYSQVYSVSLLGITTILSFNYFRYFEEEKYTLWANMVYFVISIGSLGILIPMYGIWGAVFSTIITRFSYLVFTLVVFLARKKKLV